MVPNEANIFIHLKGCIPACVALSYKCTWEIYVVYFILMVNDIL